MEDQATWTNRGGHFGYFILYLRITSPGSGASGYAFLASDTFGSQFYKATGSGFAAIGSNGPNSAVGDKIGARVVGNLLEAFHDTGGGWNQTPFVSVTDTSIVSAGRIGAVLDGAGHLINFGGGELPLPYEDDTAMILTRLPSPPIGVF